MLTLKERGTILLLWVTQKPHTLEEIHSPQFFPGYLSYEYDISDPCILHDQLLKEGYFEPASKEEILSSMTLAQLKNILSNIGEKQSGSKDILVQRVVASISDEDFHALFPSVYYRLSEAGKDLLANNQDVIILHQNPNWNISYDEYASMRGNMEASFGFRDVLWRILNERILIAHAERTWFQLSATYTSLGEICDKLDHSPATAVYYWLLACCFDMNSVMDFVWTHQKLGISFTSDEIDLIRNNIYLYPHLTKVIQKNRQFLTDKKLNNAKRHFCSFNIYTEQDFDAFCKDILSDDALDLPKWDDFCKEKSISFLKKRGLWT